MFLRLNALKDSPSTQERISGLDHICFPGDAPYNPVGSLWWVITSEGKDVAFAGIKPLKEGYGFLCRAGVLKSHQGQGLHRRLLRVRLRAAKRLGMKGVITYTVSTNPKSMNNLIKAGLTLYNPAYRYAGDVLYWRKDFK
jgi:GNAT superfamily N-acetyltransferase